MSSREAEFDCLMARAAIVIPPERRPATLAAYDELCEQIALLRQPRGPDAEPSNVFRLTPG